MRLAPAYRKRFGDFQPDSRPLYLQNLLKEFLSKSFHCLNMARVLSPAEIGEPETG